ncbi:MAG: fructose-bisphosphatase class III, partial [Eubacterium sp.]|nr:fructose-bisphosphatase class III [Eubacterium sp.]
GGFSKPYQSTTQHAGYTLIFNSWGLKLMSHEPIVDAETVIREESDIHSEGTWIERHNIRIAVADTDIGRVLKNQIRDLMELLTAYREGLIRESEKRR